VAQQKQPNPGTTAYTSHLLATTALDNYRTVIVALLPCLSLDHDIGTRLHPLSRPGHPHGSGLNSYPDDRCAESTSRAIDIVARTPAHGDDATRFATRGAFRVSAAHEHTILAAPVLVS